MENNMVFGYVPSIMNGTEHEYNGIKSLEIPKEYSYVQFLPKVYNQGNEPICVTECCRCYIDWNLNIDNSLKNDIEHKVRVYDIYNAKTNKGDGMSYKDALHYLRHNGVMTDRGLAKIERYALVKDIDDIKSALIANGPCLTAVNVRDRYYGKIFWKGDCNLGGHAITIVGYNEDGFIIRNSWGEKWGNNGHTFMPYCDYKYLLETWTIIA